MKLWYKGYKSCVPRFDMQRKLSSIKQNAERTYLYNKYYINE